MIRAERDMFPDSFLEGLEPVYGEFQDLPSTPEPEISSATPVFKGRRRFGLTSKLLLAATALSLTASLGLVKPKESYAQTTNPVAASSELPIQGPEYCKLVLGFNNLMKDLKRFVPYSLIICVDNKEQHGANGDARQGLILMVNGVPQQHLLVWRADDNWTADTDGYRTWVEGPQGLQQRLNTQRFPYEANPDHLDIADPNNPVPLGVGGGPVSTAPVSQPTPTAVPTNSPDRYVPNQNKNIIINGPSGADRDAITQGVNSGKAYYASLGFGLPSTITINIDGASQYAGAQTTIDGISIHAGSPGWTSRSFGAKAQTAAHEEFHIAQMATSNLYAGEGSTMPPVWVAEGSAERMGYGALVYGGMGSISDGRSCEVGRIKDKGQKSLAVVESQWYSLDKDGYPVYAVGFMANDFLISQRGEKSIRDYYYYLGSMTSPEAFKKAFGMDIASAMAQFDGWLAGQRGNSGICGSVAI